MKGESIFVKLKLEKYLANKKVHVGIFVDTGAARSVISEKKLEKNPIILDQSFRIANREQSALYFKFADTTFKPLGTVSLALRKAGHTHVITIKDDVVSANVPTLIGLDVLDREILMADIVHNVLYKRVAFNIDRGDTIYVEEWETPLYRSGSGKLYVPTTLTIINFTHAQIHRIHRNFFHPSSDKMYKLL